MQPETEMFRSGRIAQASGIEQARHVLSRVFLPVEFPSARKASKVGMTLNAVSVGRVTAGFMRFQDAVRIDTAEAQNFHVDIPTTQRATMRAALAAPVYATSRTAGVFMPGRPVTLDCSERFSQLSLMIPREQVLFELGQLLGENPTSPLEFRAELSLADPGGRSIMQTVRMIDTAAAQTRGPLSHPLAAQRLEEALIQSLLFGQPHNYTERLTSPSRAAGRTPVSRAVKLMRSDPAKPWTVGELAANVSMSARSLQEGFRRSLDTTPMAYLRQLRLEKAHNELAAAEPGTLTVTEVATHWGFLHLSRFAATYASAFGEHPSTTLRR
jgi:AraC-like DNA-binding protein